MRSIKSQYVDKFTRNCSKYALKQQVCGHNTTRQKVNEMNQFQTGHARRHGNRGMKMKRNGT